MATVTKSGNGLEITSTGTQNDELVLSDYLDGNYVACIEVTDGDFQFNVGSACGDDNGALVTDKRLFLTFGVAKGNINYKASATDKTFFISVV